MQSAPADAEIVVVDDGSTDQSVSLAKSTCRTWPGAFRLVRHPAGANRGPGAARNAGIQAASGDWLAFLDGDDYYLPNRFATDLQMLEANASLDGVVSVTRMDIAATDQEPQQKGVGQLGLTSGASGSQVLADLLAERFWHANALTVRRSLVQSLGGFPAHLRMSEDCALWLRLALSGCLRASSDSEPVAVYRRRSGSTLQVGLESMAWLLQALTETCDWARQHGIPSHMRRVLAQGARNYFVKTAGSAHLQHDRLVANVMCKRFLQAGGWRLLWNTKAAWLVLRIGAVRLCGSWISSCFWTRLPQTLFAAAWDRPLSPADDMEQNALLELRHAFAALPEMDCSGYLPSEAAWRGNMNTLRELVLQENPRAFIRWPVIYQSMFVQAVPYVRKEFRYLRSRADWATRWRNAVRECRAGNPFPCWFYPPSSGNLLHHAYHLAQFEEQMGCAVHEMDVVVEFGGGYGSMCRLLYNMGFRGQYLMFDLAHFSHLQRFFLKASRHPLVGAQDEAPAVDGIACLSSFDALKVTLQSFAPQARKMFMATWSLSEVPVPLREKVLPLFNSFDTYLIGYQGSFGEVDNVAYFGDWCKSMPHIQWAVKEIRHLPADWYLFGNRRLRGDE